MPSTPLAFSSRTCWRASSGVFGVRTNCAFTVSLMAAGRCWMNSVPWPPSAVNIGPQTKSCAPSLAPSATRLAQLERSVQAIAHAARGGHAAIQQCGGGVRHGLLDVVILRVGGDAAGGRQVHVRVDQAGQQRLAGALDDLGLQLVGIRRGAFVDLGDLAVAHQHGAVLDHFAVADKDARVPDQEHAGALQVAIERGVLPQMLLAVGLARAHQRRTAPAPRAPRACCAAGSSLPFPSGRVGWPGTGRARWSAAARPPPERCPRGSDSGRRCPGSRSPGRWRA